MNLKDVFCPNQACCDRYKRGAGNIVWHGRKRPRCKCTRCGRTFSYRYGTMFHGLRTPEATVILVVTLVAYGCPVAAIVAAFGLDERTVAAWLQRAGHHAEVFHHQRITRHKLQQVQVDELRLKIQGQIVWVAMALAVGSRLWLGAVCRPQRDRQLARQIITCVYTWAHQAPLVISFDGWNAYPKACRLLFRERFYSGKVGNPRLIPWPQLTLVQVVKHTRKSAFGITRWVLQGSCTMLRRLLEQTQGQGTINTAYIERLFATFRGRLAFCTRRSRHPARLLATVAQRIYLVGCLYNFCDCHRSLGKRTPAMAAGLTDHPWSVYEFLWQRPKPFWASTV
jgi:transposase-like protein